MHLDHCIVSECNFPWHTAGIGHEALCKAAEAKMEVGHSWAWAPILIVRTRFYHPGTSSTPLGNSHSCDELSDSEVDKIIIVLSHDLSFFSTVAENHIPRLRLLDAGDFQGQTS